MNLNLDHKLQSDLAALANEVGHSLESYIIAVLREWALRERETNNQESEA